jgi:superoxide dismutase, Cu-Zn family
MNSFRSNIGVSFPLAILTFTAACGETRESADTAARRDTVAGAAGSAGAEAAGTMATVALRDSAGQDVGTAELRQDGGSVRVTVSVTGLPAGEHGIHFHENGSCEHSGEAFGGAGSHFAPSGRQHGLENPQGPHAGDLPNLQVSGDGSGRLEATTDRVTLMGGANALSKAGGTALVIHAQPDDQRTDPSGNSGARVACGIIPAA